ncbi:MAG TPA: class I SAM-dependent methyltransferase, partial [Roseiflexaceae bacterium]|nr:class I SAM-dependent methyltransferase [Roseiflexaceae bacterium]
MGVSTGSGCPLCGSLTHCLHLEVNSYRIVRCERCEFLFVDPAPTATELSRFYQQPEYYADSTVGYADYLGDRARHEQLAAQRLERIDRLLPGRGRIVDIGCAAGFFLHAAQGRGWEPFGVELSQDMAAFATQLIGPRVVSNLAELAAAPGSFDAVTGWEYIEHVPNPRDELEQLVALLKPGGVLALSTPNTGYWVA